MTRQEHDDVGSLFKAIGTKTRPFKEFGTANNAAQAQERWPLFKTLDLEKRPPPPQLQSNEKKIWEKTSVAPAPIKPASKKTAPSLGNQIAKGLRSMVHPTTDTPAAHKLAPISAPEAEITTAAPRLGKARNTFATPPAAVHATPAHAAHAAHAAPAHSVPAQAVSTHTTAPRGLFAKPISEAAPAAPRGLFAKATISEPEATPPKKSLFGKVNQSDAGKPSSASEATRPSENKLSSLFARLEHPEPEPTKGLFGRKRQP